MEKRRADAVTCTARRAYFELILLQDSSVKERCDLRQYPEGLVDALVTCLRQEKFILYLAAAGNLVSVCHWTPKCHSRELLHK